MRRIALTILGLAVSACAANMGGPRDVSVSAVALRSDAGTAPSSAASALPRGGDARVALVAAEADSAWFASVASAADLHLSGPARAGDLSMALMAMEPLGDTVLELSYDGGTIPMVDALYDLDERHFLDLMFIRVAEGDAIQPLVTRMLRYIATDVPPSAAVLLAVAVPSAAVGDSIAGLLSPGFFDAGRCGSDEPPASVRGQVRLFYGPEARFWCNDARGSATAAGARIHAELVAGLRR